MRKTLLLLFLISLTPLLHAQQPQTMQQEYDFIMYLVGSGLKNDAVTAMERTTLTGDSIEFLKGYAFYSARMLDSSVACFSKVSPASPLFAESMFFASLSKAHLGYPSDAEKLLERIPDDDDFSNLRKFEIAGMRLLQRDLDAFDRYYSLLDTTDFRLTTEANNLLTVRKEIASHKNRRPWVAGTLSALVPGLGRIYAGNFGEGLASFLLVGSMAAVTTENWLRKGPANWKTIVAGLLSTVFYIGNIYGSVAAVKVAMNDFNHQMDVQILYDIHIPLRASFRH